MQARQAVVGIDFGHTTHLKRSSPNTMNSFQKADFEHDAADRPWTGEAEFRSACSKFPTGVTVTTVTGTDGMPYGIAVSSFTSVSLDPPLVLVCIDHRSQMVKHLALAQPLGINILAEDQQALSIRFSRNWAERFIDEKWYRGYTGVPLLPNVLATFECSIIRIISVGDHLIVIAKVACVTYSGRSPLAYFDRSYRAIAVENLPPLSSEHRQAGDRPARRNILANSEK